MKIVHLRNTLVLDLRGMLKAAVHDGTQHLRLQQEVAEPGGVDGHVVALDFPLLLRGAILRTSLGCRGLGLRIIFVVQQLLVDINIIVCHLVNCGEDWSEKEDKLKLEVPQLKFYDPVHVSNHYKMHMRSRKRVGFLQHSARAFHTLLPSLGPHAY